MSAGPVTPSADEPGTDLRLFATVGTDHHRFDRMIEWVEAWAASKGLPPEQVLIQRGTSDAPTRCRSVDYFASAELAAELDHADVVVCHGGPSTIMEARARGHVPVVMPRDPARGEHVDGHQQAFAQHLARHDAIHLADSPDALAAGIDAVLANGGRAGHALQLGDRDATLATLGNLVDDLTSKPRRRLALLRSATAALTTRGSRS